LALLRLKITVTTLSSSESWGSFSMTSKYVVSHPRWGVTLTHSRSKIEVKTAQPRSQRDQQRHVATTPPSSFNNSQIAPTNAATPMGNSMPFMSMNSPTGAGDMSTMMYQRMMGGMGTPYAAMMGAGGGMGMMGGFNPMMGMGMGMGRFGMGGMGAMNPMAATAAAAGGMRLGMGPIGMAGAGAGMGGMGGGAAGMGGAAAAGVGAAGMGMGGMGGMGMRQNMGGMMGGGGVGRGRPGMNQGPGPARVTNRGQHGFHPYAR
jgi:RNA-binding protein Musashi